MEVPRRTANYKAHTTNNKGHLWNSWRKGTNEGRKTEILNKTRILSPKLFNEVLHKINKKLKAKTLLLQVCMVYRNLYSTEIEDLQC